VPYSRPTIKKQARGERRTGELSDGKNNWIARNSRKEKEQALELGVDGKTNQTPITERKK
jgi:hypothetical protein